MPSTTKVSWSGPGIDELSHDNLRALFDSGLPAIRIPGFASPAECEALVAAVDDVAFAYSPFQSPPIGRIGITQYGHHAAPEVYFAGVPDARRTVRQLFARSFDPVSRIIGILRGAWPADVGIATGEQGPYHAGLVRMIHDHAGLHFDFVPIEGRGWSIDDVDAQVSWNLHLSVPDSGGACIVYDRRCEREHEAAKADPDSLLADPLLVADRPSIILDGIVGDVVLFNTRYYHEILPCRGGRRITVSSFIGRKPDGSLVLWS